MADAFDLIIVGAGGAGLAAAIEAADRGLRVVVVDAALEAGGTASTSGGGTFVAASPLHEKLGLRDSWDLAYEDWITWGGESVDREWARRYIEASAVEVFGWLSALGVGWERIQAQEGNRVPRWHAPENGGYGVMQALERAARTRPSIDWRLGTYLTGLLTTGGRVSGITVEAEGKSSELQAGAVILATGGFNNSRELVERWATGVPAGTRVLLGGGPGAKGSAHLMLDELGAQLVNLNSIWFYPFAIPDPDDPAGERGLVSRGLNGEIWVNTRGERFHNETLRGGATGAPALLRQTPATCWSIVDSRIMDGFFVSDPRYRTGSTNYPEAIARLITISPDISKAESVSDLAGGIGLDPAALAATVGEHNRRIISGEAADQFGRKLAGLPTISEPPFYALNFFPLARKNLGGVRTDPNCQVLDTSDRPIPGLYAAGELAGMAGGHINGRYALEGTMIGPSIYSGRIAGQSAEG